MMTDWLKLAMVTVENKSILKVVQSRALSPHIGQRSLVAMENKGILKVGQT